MVVPHPEIDTYALLTRPPLPVARPCDLHVLSMPPAFALSQDQTLRFIMSNPKRPNQTNKPCLTLSGSAVTDLPSAGNHTHKHKRNASKSRHITRTPKS